MVAVHEVACLSLRKVGVLDSVHNLFHSRIGFILGRSWTYWWFSLHIIYSNSFFMKVSPKLCSFGINSWPTRNVNTIKPITETYLTRTPLMGREQSHFNSVYIQWYHYGIVLRVPYLPKIYTMRTKALAFCQFAKCIYSLLLTKASALDPYSVAYPWCVAASLPLQQ